MLVVPRVRVLKGTRPAYALLPFDSRFDVAVLVAAAPRRPDTIPVKGSATQRAFVPADAEMVARKMQLMLAGTFALTCREP